MKHRNLSKIIKIYARNLNHNEYEMPTDDRNIHTHISNVFQVGSRKMPAWLRAIIEIYSNPSYRLAFIVLFACVGNQGALMKKCLQKTDNRNVELDLYKGNGPGGFQNKKKECNLVLNKKNLNNDELNRLPMVLQKS